MRVAIRVQSTRRPQSLHGVTLTSTGVENDASPCCASTRGRHPGPDRTRVRCPGAGACRHHAARRRHGATRRRHRLTFGLLPATAIPALPSFESTLADQPVITSLPLPTSFNTNLLGSTISTTLLEGHS